MALTFPRDMPCPVPGEVSFALERQQARALAGSGTPQVVEIGPAMWAGKWSMQLGEAAFFTWSAWLASLRGGLRTFKGRPRRQFPRAHPRGFVGHDGTGTLSAIGVGSDNATLAGLPLGCVLQPGDYFSVAVGTKQHLHRITEGGTATAGSVVVSFEPVLRPNAAVDAVVRVVAPWCDMVISDITESSAQGGGAVSFQGTQVLF